MNREFEFICVGLSFLLLGISSWSEGANVDLTLEYVGSYDSALFPVGTPLVDDPSSVTPLQYHQFDVSFAISGAAANEDIGSLNFDVLLGPGFTPADFGGYSGVEPSFPPPPPPPPFPGPLYPINEDGGVNPNDLKNIVVVANATAAHAIRPGIVSSGKFGNVFIQWDGTHGLDGTTSLGLASRGAMPWSLYVGATAVSQTQENFETLAPLVFGPSGAGGTAPDAQDVLHPQMDGSAAANPVPITHTFTQLGGTAPITWSNFMLESYTPNYGGAGTGPIAIADFDPLTQQFSWDPVGSPRGSYVWKVTAGNDFGTDIGRLTIQIKSVPEPATFAMVGLALVGLVGVARRRS